MRPAWLRFVVTLLCLLGLGCAVIGCEDEDDGTTPIADAVLPELALTDETPDLVITWIDDRGETHTGIALSEVRGQTKASKR